MNGGRKIGGNITLTRRISTFDSCNAHQYSQKLSRRKGLENYRPRSPIHIYSSQKIIQNLIGVFLSIFQSGDPKRHQHTKPKWQTHIYSNCSFLYPSTHIDLDRPLIQRSPCPNQTSHNQQHHASQIQHTPIINQLMRRLIPQPHLDNLILDPQRLRVIHLRQQFLIRR